MRESILNGVCKLWPKLQKWQAQRMFRFHGNNVRPPGCYSYSWVPSAALWQRFGSQTPVQQDSDSDSVKRCAYTKRQFKFLPHTRQSVLQTFSSHRNCLALAAPWNYISVRWKVAPRYPPLIESEIEESYMRGGGPGGQAVAKTSNAVQLLHKPTGVVIKCHETRSLVINRKTGRRRLQEALDWHYNGEQSYIVTQQREEAKRKQKKKSRTRKKYEELAEKKLKAAEELKEQEQRELEQEDREIEKLKKQEQPVPPKENAND